MSMTREQAEVWLATYKQAWKGQDPELVVSLFAPECSYWEDPFETVSYGHEGVRDYWLSKPCNQSNIKVETQLLAIESDYVIAHWHASHDREGKHREMDGIFKLTFNADGLCTELREWWHIKRTPIEEVNNAA